MYTPKKNLLLFPFRHVKDVGGFENLRHLMFTNRQNIRDTHSIQIAFGKLQFEHIGGMTAQHGI